MFLSELELSVDAVPCGQAEPVDRARLRVEPLYDDVLKQIPYESFITVQYSPLRTTIQCASAVSHS